MRGYTSYAKPTGRPAVRATKSERHSQVLLTLKRQIRDGEESGDVAAIAVSDGSVARKRWERPQARAVREVDQQGQFDPVAGLRSRMAGWWRTSHVLIPAAPPPRSPQAAASTVKPRPQHPHG
ncbi:hypothetical protein Arub01_27680 [Actinomadura rubrobrunea]|uniref:Uncharacterized protein n=1 Tax=Actinomadura rubrobrunea TaxID=115335 RepID=A0A9W6PWW0_9ACTN|nr:hypothetical protein Arub01_27680 [Actinomadura rubrobrunea]